MGDVVINGSVAVRFFVSGFQFAPVFFLVIGYAKNDFFSIALLDQRGFQACRYFLSDHHHPIMMDK